MKISELIKKEYVVLNLNATSKEDALQQIAQIAKGHPHLGDFPSFCRAIYERESTGTTSIGHGVAIPHARTEQVKDMIFVIGRLAEGIKFAPTDEIPVRLIFLVGTPKKMVAEYLRLIGTLARHLQAEDLRKKLLISENPEDVIKAFEERESASF